jgi:hypothetical protein
MSSEQKVVNSDSGIGEEIEMLRRIIWRVYQLALAEQSLERLEHTAQTLSTAINRLGGLLKLQRQLGIGERDEIMASFHEALELVTKELKLRL